MWSFLIAAAVALQAPSVEELAARLGDESPIVREEAIRDLVKRCDEASPVLRKLLPGASGDAWKLYDRVLEKCEGESRRRAFLGTPPKVSFSVDNRPLVESLEGLAKRLGFPLAKIYFPDRPVTAEVKDLVPLEALDSFCRTAGLGWRIQWPPPYAPLLGALPNVTFQGTSTPGKAPRVLYVKNYRISMGGLHLQRNRTPAKDESTAGVGGMIQASPRMGDVALEELAFEKIVDDRGNVLYQPDPPGAGSVRRHRDSRLGGASPVGHISWGATMKHPDAAAKSIAVIRAKATLRCEMERRHIALEASEKALDQVVEFEGVKVRLTMFRKEEGKLIFGVTQEGRRTPAEASDTCWPVGEQRFDYAELRMKDGSTVRTEGIPRPVGRGGERLYTFPHSGEPAEFRFVTYRVWAFDSIEFEFRDIPIPN